MTHLSAVGEHYDDSARVRVALFTRAARIIERRGYKPAYSDETPAVTLDQALNIAAHSFDDPARARRDGGILAMSRFVNVYPSTVTWHRFVRMLDAETAAEFFDEIASLIEQDTHTQGERQ